jgi:hypothetical protein
VRVEVADFGSNVRRTDEEAGYGVRIPVAVPEG